ncbi:hypothetical protein [Chamaesiphon sp. GL140_3_metabinner_50]|nr:hypothetical protein [Chamaesiphon sp. GL140_3_metabinner_50]
MRLKVARSRVVDDLPSIEALIPMLNSTVARSPIPSAIDSVNV